MRVEWNKLNYFYIRMKKFIENLGGRKFIFATILMIILGIMVIMQVEIENIKTFFNYAITIFGLYVGGNVATKFSEESKQ